MLRLLPVVAALGLDASRGLAVPADRVTGETPILRDEPAVCFCCTEDNDLYRVVRQAGVRCPRREGFAAAVERAPAGAGLLVLADDYPEQRVDLDPEALRVAQQKGLRLYVEFPAAFPGLDLGEPQPTQWERAVVASGFFGADLPPLTILALHGCQFSPVRSDPGTLGAPLVIARVAGYDTAVYGLPEQRFPLLCEVPEQHALVATTGLSHFVRGRYGPQAAWRTIWRRILQWLAPDAAWPDLDWTPAVGPTHGRDERRPAEAERRAFNRGARWFVNSRLLVDESWLEPLAEITSRGGEAAALPRERRIGDGRLGMLEGYSAEVGADGSQSVRTCIRNDCLGESAMACAFDALVNDRGHSATVARNLGDYICFDSLIQQGIRADPLHPTFGLMAWGTTSWAWERAFYGDDNARSLLGLMAAAALLDMDRWDESMLRALLANLRTTGRLGFRGWRIDVPDLEQNGWRLYHDREIVTPSAHYESYLWACFLWAYRATGYEPFRESATAGIRRMMEAYPDGWSWTYGLVLDRARMLLCLAWLVRVEDTPEHRQWLLRVAADLLRYQEPCGAIREAFGDAGGAPFAAVPSNEAYGTAETPLIQQDGDPATDLLYTTNFAFLGLHEAVAATGDRRLRRAEDRLAEFLCRVQVRAPQHPELDGAWMRAFDFERWEHWGSSADVGWGAWCIESGWTQAWITAVFGLRLLGTALWDLTADSGIGERLPGVQALMALNDGGPYVPQPEPIAHLAVGATYTLATPADDRYPDDGAALTDGQGWPARAHPEWCGWMGPTLDVTVDLGREQRVSEVGAEFMRNPDIGIFLPTSLRVSLAPDGRAFRADGERALPPPVPGDRLTDKALLTVPVRGRARFVRLQATPIGPIPAWHSAAGVTGWLFADEVVVR